MKRIRFRDPTGFTRIGHYTGDDIAYGDSTYNLDEVTVLPPTTPSKIVCVGLNYADHVEETDSEYPERPMFFLKGPNAAAAHGDVIELLEGKDRIDYEAELGVVIGKQCKHVAEDNAEDMIAGYTCVNDISNRDDQFQEQNWIRGKAFDNAAPFGPVVASPKHLPENASIELRRNGDVKQSSSIDNLIFSVSELIADVTQYMTLERGDVIATGTTAGVGPIQGGDEITVHIEGVGQLTNEFTERY